MKKLLSGLLSVVMLFSLFAVQVSAAGATLTLRPEITTNRIDPGDTFEIWIVPSDSDMELVELSFEISCPDGITSVSADKGTARVSGNRITYSFDGGFSETQGPGDTISGTIVLRVTTSSTISAGTKRFELLGDYAEAYTYSIVEEEPPVSSGDTSSSDTSSSGSSSQSVSSEQTAEQAEPGASALALAARAGERYQREEVDVRVSSGSLSVTVNDTSSSDATLTSLSVAGYTLSPAFDPDVTRYTVEIADDVTSVRISATPSYSGASVSNTGTVQLADGTSVTVLVTVDTGTSSNIYRITFRRPGAVSSEEEEETSSEEDFTPSRTETSEEPDETSSGLPVGPIVTTSEDGTSDGTSSASTSSSGGGGAWLLPIILTIVLSLVAGFLIAFILFRFGIIKSYSDQDDLPEEDEGLLPPGEESEDADFNTQDPIRSDRDDPTTAIPIPMQDEEPVPQPERKPKYKIDIQYDDTIGAPQEQPEKKEQDLGGYQIIEEPIGGDTPKKSSEEKPKKKPYFYDDDEF